MKKISFKIAAIVILASMLFSLTGCIKTAEARECTENFLALVSKGNFESAQKLLHPEANWDLKEFDDTLKTKLNISFTDGVTVLRYSGFNTNVSFGGSSYTHTVNTLFGEVSVTLKVILGKNDAGFGITGLNVYADTDSPIDTEPSNGQI
jgi:hypothetical protein